jgi:hypothetical protein
MPHFLDLSGKTFGRLIVLHQDKTSTDKRIRWVVKCNLCQNVFSIRSNNLISRNVKRCIHCKATPNEKDFVGKVINDFTIIKFDGFYENQGWWIVKYKNGEERRVKTSSLKNKRSLKKVNKNDFDSSISELYRKYSHSAKKRKLDFNIDVSYFSKIIFENCFYCGDKPSNIQKSKNNNKIPLKYNGIDRKNNELGYIKDNVVSCCRICNRAKSNLHYKKWIDYIVRISKNVDEKKY